MLRRRTFLFVFVAFLFLSPIVIQVAVADDDAEEGGDEAVDEEPTTESDPPEEADGDGPPLAIEAGGESDATTEMAATEDGVTGNGDTADTDDDSEVSGTTPSSTGEAMATTESTASCEKNNTGVAIEKRECRSFCSEQKKCRNPKADCKCDGVCGMVCVLPDMRCPKPTAPENGKVEAPEIPLFGIFAKYSCDDKYELIGPEKRVCRGDQQWGEKEPFCTLKGVRCSEPPFRFENSSFEGDITRSEYYINEKVMYKCDDGYGATEGEDEVESECELLDDGTTEWKNVTLSCTPKLCEAPPSIEKGLYEEKEFYFGDEVTYKCEPGYQILDNPVRECDANLTWGDDLPVCEKSKIVCPEPEDPEHGKVSYESLAFGFTVTYECDIGFIINGTETRECSEDSDWSDEEPTCIDIDCGKPDEPSNGTIIFLSETGYNAQVDFACEENATPSGPTSAVCDKDGKWNPPAPQCLRHCEVEELDNAFLMFAGITKYQRYNMIPTGVFMPHNSSVQIVCDEGYEVPSNETTLIPRALTECGDGTWSPTTECVEARCFCDELDYSKLEERNLLLAKECEKPIASGEELQLKCHPTYPEMKAKGTLKCEQREWIYPNDTDIRCVLKSCSVKDIKLDHGNIEKDQEDWLPDKDSNIVPNATELRFECTEDGYELHVGGKPVAPITAENVTTTRECNNGTWSGRMPICRPARCLCNDLNETIPERGLAEIDCEFLSSGQLKPLECKSGFAQPAGLLVAECSYGSFKPLTAECQQVCHCDALEKNLTGTSLQISGKCDDSVVLNDTITLECAKGYENMTGDAEAFCLDGDWVLPDASCNATVEAEVEAAGENTTGSPEMDTTNTTLDVTGDTEGSGTAETGEDAENSTATMSSEEEASECKFEADSKKLFAYHEGELVTDDGIFKTGDVIQFRCSNVYNLKLDGADKIHCVNGKWSNSKPRCQSLLPNIVASAPPILLLTGQRDYPPVTEDGTVILARNTQPQIRCLWAIQRPLMSIEGNIYPTQEREFRHGRLAGWAYIFDRITQSTEFTFTCATPNQDPQKQLSHSIKIKVAGTCELDEKTLFQTENMRLVPSTRRVVYTEGDVVRFTCRAVDAAEAFESMECTADGIWEYGDKQQCE